MRKIKICAAAAFLAVCMTFPSYAGQWIQENNAWSYIQEDGTPLQNQWFQDADGRWYYLNGNGHMAVNKVTPDRYVVGKDGVYMPGMFGDRDRPVDPWSYQQLLGHGMDVDWSKVREGRENYTPRTVDDFCREGISHVRIRVKDDLTYETLESLDRQINDCLDRGMIPILAYQADEFKNNPNQETINGVVEWWRMAAERYQDKSHMLAFDLMIECSDELNKQPEQLNRMIEQAVAAIRESNPDRIIMMSPRLRSDPAYLSELRIPSKGNGYMMAEWHFYASGPSKTNERKLWTTGTDSEKQLVLDKISLAAAWQQQTGIPTWVGAWMAGNYNDGNDYSLDEQIAFAGFMCDSLDRAGIPFAVNSDTKFYDRENKTWVGEMVLLRDMIFK